MGKLNEPLPDAEVSVSGLCASDCPRATSTRPMKDDCYGNAALAVVKARRVALDGVGMGWPNVRNGSGADTKRVPESRHLQWPLFLAALESAHGSNRPFDFRTSSARRNMERPRSE